MLSPNGSFCAPKCDADTCPPPDSGDAIAACAFNPSSSFLPCRGMCANQDEACVQVGIVAFCMLPSTHCMLLCGDGETCPAGMQCAVGGYCHYP